MKKKESYCEKEVIKIGLEQLNKCVNLDKKTLNGMWSTNGWAKELASESKICLGLIKKEQLLGCICASKTLDEINITFLAVQPKHQNLGIGKALILKLLAITKTGKAMKAILEVKEHNHSAIRLYERLCFKKIGLRRNFYKDGSNGIIFQRVY